MTSAPGPRIPRTGGTQVLVEVLTSYLNLADQVTALRTPSPSSPDPMRQPMSPTLAVDDLAGSRYTFKDTVHSMTLFS
jgi:hypothetical protein